MFSTGHLIWIFISAAIIIAGLFLCFRFRPALKKLLTVCTALGALSEVIKLFSVSVIVPVVDPVITERGGSAAIDWQPSGDYTPYLPLEHLPLELCSLFLFFMLIALLLKSASAKKFLYAVMFASGTIGGIMGIVLSSIAADHGSVSAFFSSARAWQFFLFHSMVVIVAVYIGFGKESKLKFADWKKAVLGLLVLDLPTFYLNSLLSSEVYVHNRVIGVTHRINFFSSYVNPLGLILTEKWQWIVYLVIRLLLAAGLIILLYLSLGWRVKPPEEAANER